MKMSLRNVLKKIECRAEQITNQLIGHLDTETLPPRIAHYTTKSGMDGVIDSGNFWLSNTFQMNDPKEIKHGVEIATNILKNVSQEKSKEVQQFATMLQHLLYNGGVEGSAHYFSMSFCENGDDIDRWRSYGDDGHGYALVFDGLELETAFINEGGIKSPHNSTFRVMYNDNFLSPAYMEFINFVVPQITPPKWLNIRESERHEYVKEIFYTFALFVIRLAIFFKHEGYASEKEYRLLQIFHGHVKAPNVQTRLRHGENIQYREFKWAINGRSALKKIIVGPAVDDVHAALNLRNVLDQKGYKHVAVEKSTIPYRSQRAK